MILKADEIKSFLSHDNLFIFEKLCVSFYSFFAYRNLPNMRNGFIWNVSFDFSIPLFIKNHRIPNSTIVIGCEGRILCMYTLANRYCQ